MIDNEEVKTPIEKYFETYPLLKGFSKNWSWMKDVNHCNPYYAPLLYIIARGMRANQILEIGCELGYSSYMLAQAAKENQGKYYCVEIGEQYARQLKKGIEEEGFPGEVIWADTHDIKEWEWSKRLDLVLCDGDHSKEAIEHEFSWIYPKLDPGGYIFLHDTEAWSADGFKSILENPKYEFDHISFVYNYGMTIFRKKRADYDKIIKENAEQSAKGNLTQSWTRGIKPPKGQITKL